MIRLAEVAEAFLSDLEAHYSDRLLPGHRNALSAILRCRTEACVFRTNVDALSVLS